MGSIEIEANDEHCVDWKGTKADAIELQKDYLRLVERAPISAELYAKRAAGYLMTFGMPKEGDPDQRPSCLGATWTKQEIDLYVKAVLWMALREHVPNQPGQRLEDVLPGKVLLVVLRGDRRAILAETMRELNGEAFSFDGAFTMMVAELSDYRLNPQDAVTMPYRDLLVMAGLPPLVETDGKLYHEVAYVPRLPRDADEARAMLQFTTIFVDATNPIAVANPQDAVCTYVGYTDDELRRDKPAVVIGRNNE